MNVLSGFIEHHKRASEGKIKKLYKIAQRENNVKMPVVEATIDGDDFKVILPKQEKDLSRASNTQINKQEPEPVVVQHRLKEHP